MPCALVHSSPSFGFIKPPFDPSIHPFTPLNSIQINSTIIGPYNPLFPILADSSTLNPVYLPTSIESFSIPFENSPSSSLSLTEKTIFANGFTLTFSDLFIDSGLFYQIQTDLTIEDFKEICPPNCLMSCDSTYAFLNIGHSAMTIHNFDPKNLQIRSNLVLFIQKNQIKPIVCHFGSSEFILNQYLNPISIPKTFVHKTTTPQMIDNDYVSPLLFFPTNKIIISSFANNSEIFYSDFIQETVQPPHLPQKVVLHSAQLPNKNLLPLNQPFWIQLSLSSFIEQDLLFLNNSFHVTPGINIVPILIEFSTENITIGESFLKLELEQEPIISLYDQVTHSVIFISVPKNPSGKVKWFLQSNLEKSNSSPLHEKSRTIQSLQNRQNQFFSILDCTMQPNDPASLEKVVRILENPLLSLYFPNCVFNETIGIYSNSVFALQLGNVLSMPKEIYLEFDLVHCNTCLKSFNMIQSFMLKKFSSVQIIATYSQLQSLQNLYYQQLMLENVLLHIVNPQIIPSTFTLSSKSVDSDSKNTVEPSSVIECVSFPGLYSTCQDIVQIVDTCDFSWGAISIMQDVSKSCKIKTTNVCKLRILSNKCLHGLTIDSSNFHNIDSRFFQRESHSLWTGEISNSIHIPPHPKKSLPMFSWLPLFIGKMHPEYFPQLSLSNQKNTHFDSVFGPLAFNSEKCTVLTIFPNHIGFVSHTIFLPFSVDNFSLSPWSFYLLCNGIPSWFGHFQWVQDYGFSVVDTVVLSSSPFVQYSPYTVSSSSPLPPNGNPTSDSSNWLLIGGIFILALLFTSCLMMLIITMKNGHTNTLSRFFSKNAGWVALDDDDDYQDDQVEEIPGELLSDVQLDDFEDSQVDSQVNSQANS